MRRFLILLVAIIAVAIAGPMVGKRLLENKRVKVTELIYEPGVARERYIRPTDQVIVFLDDCEYERTDSQTGEKTIRKRKSGEVIWHDRGEDAPKLINLGRKPYRTLVIELP